MLALAIAAWACFHPRASWAVAETDPIHASGDREVWDRRRNRVELFGHAVVRQPGEQLSADHIVLDQSARTLDAHGNCVYVTSDSIIYGDEMHFNLDTRTGTIVGGRVANERFTLGGERINKLGEGRFQTHWGEYSTCRDCTQSWTIQAQDVDMEVEGYAHLRNVTIKLKDTPALWFPYLIVPMKTRRQTGLLFPQIAFSGQNGFALVQPFFWAVSRSADMTFGAGEFSKKGVRATWEGRYALSERSGGKANFYFLRDQEFGNPELTSPTLNPSGGTNRWALDVSQVQELPWHIEEKLRVVEISDNYYPIFIGDVPGLNELTVSSTASLSYASSSLSAFVGARRIRNLLDVNLDAGDGIRRFDPYTVQVYPSAIVTTNDQAIAGWPVAAGLTLGVTNFTRSAGPFDLDVFSNPTTRAAPFPDPGVDPIREAIRFSVNPSLYASVRPWDVFTFTPSVKYFGYFYSFHNVVDNWYRGYALFQADLSAQLEKVYDVDDKFRPRRKHLIRPILTYSYIPQKLVHQDPHPFLSQIQYAEDRGFTGYNFDNLDIVPIDSSPVTGTQYFVPLGNSLAYGLTTQLIERRGEVQDPLASYATPVEFSLGQAINFREFQKFRREDPSRARDPQPLTRFFSTLNLNLDDRLLSGTTYYYYPYISGIRHQISTSATYVIDRSTRQRILSFDRSLSAGYTWNKVGCTDEGCPKAATSNLVFNVNYSLSDYILPSFSGSYDYQTQNLLRTAVNLQFQSPSQCWKLTLSGSKEIGQKPNWGIDLAVNLTGSGFGGATDLVTQAVAPK